MRIDNNRPRLLCLMKDSQNTALMRYKVVKLRSVRQQHSARCSGWCAQVLKQLEDNRLYRPLSEYVGEPVGKKVVPIDERP